MKFTIQWLKKHMQYPVTLDTIREALDSLHLELDSFVKIGGEGFVVGKILEIHPHPNSDKLKICVVAYNENNIQHTKSIVCGAQNVKVGLHTILAVSGAILPNGIIISHRNIRGVMSSGMLLSYEEFGLKHIKKEGIIDEHPHLLHQLIKEDYIITIDLPANRIDLSSVRGMAMELSSYFNSEMINLYSGKTPDKIREHSTTVVITQEDLVHNFSTMECDNIHINDEYYEIMSLFLKIGNMTHIPVVNVANFITLDLGVPLHIYDRDKINGLEVTLLTEEEKFITLNGEEVGLKPGHMVIKNKSQDRPGQTLLVAGIIGGFHSSCTPETKNILVEAAIFNKKYYINAYRDLNIQNTSTYYFNRGINYFTHLLALQYFKEFITGAYSTMNIINYKKDRRENGEIFLSYDVFYRLTGLSFSLDHIKQILEPYHYKVHLHNQEGEGLNNEMGLYIKPPLWKPYIVSAQDVVEEIVRISPNNIIANRDLTLEMLEEDVPDIMDVLFNVEDLFVLNGYKEVISYSFVKQHNNLYIPNAIGNNKYLRCNLLEAMEEHMENIVHNKLGMEYNGKLFEISRVFSHENEIIKEHYNLAIGILNNIHRYGARDMRSELVNILGKLSSILNVQINLCANGTVEINNKMQGHIIINNNYLMCELYNLDSILMGILDPHSHQKVVGHHVHYEGTVIVRDYSCIMNNKQLHVLLALARTKYSEDFYLSVFDAFKDSYGIRVKYFTNNEHVYENSELHLLKIFKEQGIVLRDK